MKTHTNVNRDNLNSVMEFDHVIRVHADGTVTDAAEYAPELCDGALPADSPWSLMTGYTGQYGYRGPIMHPSEFIGGGMADDILSTPGLYVALINYTSDPADWCDDCRPGSGESGPCDSHDINGWGVAYIHDDTASVTYRDGDREVTVPVPVPANSGCRFGYERHSAHSDYPHEPGYLHDCRACEERCHCTDGDAECVWSGHDVDRPMTDAERAEHDRYHVHKRPGCQACEDIDRDDSPDSRHEWQRAPLTGAVTCSRCGLLPIDDDDIDTRCRPGD